MERLGTGGSKEAGRWRNETGTGGGGEGAWRRKRNEFLLFRPGGEAGRGVAAEEERVSFVRLRT